MRRNSELNRTARDRMHAVLTPEFFLMWMIGTWFDSQEYQSHATETLRRVTRWVIHRYLGGVSP